jgi:hypothetical protein
MITMIDEIYDRNYRAGREAMNSAIAASISRFGAAFGNAFRVLHNIEYSAPWARPSKAARHR